MTDSLHPIRWERWCGICFAWRAEHAGRCVACGNAHMTGEQIPRVISTEPVASTRKETL